LNSERGRTRNGDELGTGTQLVFCGGGIAASLISSPVSRRTRQLRRIRHSQSDNLVQLMRSRRKNPLELRTQHCGGAARGEVWRDFVPGAAALCPGVRGKGGAKWPSFTPGLHSTTGDYNFRDRWRKLGGLMSSNVRYGAKPSTDSPATVAFAGAPYGRLTLEIWHSTRPRLECSGRSCLVWVAAACIVEELSAAAIGDRRGKRRLVRISLEGEQL